MIWFGHIGDGNLHINILKPRTLEEDAFLKQCEKANEILFSLVKKTPGDHFRRTRYRPLKKTLAGLHPFRGGNSPDETNQTGF